MVSITSQAPHIIHNPMDWLNGLSQIVKNVFHKPEEEGKDLFKCLMIYHNTPLTSRLPSPMQLLQSRPAR